MIKLLPYIIAIMIVLIVIIVVLITALRRVKKEEETLRRINDNYKMAASKVEENIKNANEEKKKLHTGDPIANVDNATDIMRNISRKRSQS